MVWKTLKVRPAFLLGVIREESNLGANVGKGNWKNDLYDCYVKLGYKTVAEKQKNAFLTSFFPSVLTRICNRFPKNNRVDAAGRWGRLSLCQEHGRIIKAE